MLKFFLTKVGAIYWKKREAVFALSERECGLNKLILRYYNNGVMSDVLHYNTSILKLASPDTAQQAPISHRLCSQCSDVQQSQQAQDMGYPP